MMSAPATHPGDGDAPGPAIRPFRPLVFDAAVVSSLAAVSAPSSPVPGPRAWPGASSRLGRLTAPPYDLLSPPDRARTQQLDPHNVVHLTVPPRDLGDAATIASEHAEAADLLRQWRSSGALREEGAPMMLVYEIVGNGVRTRGLLAVVSVDGGDGTVLPHEEVVDAVVAERAELMRVTGAQLEPILLTYDGGPDATAPDTRELLDAVSATEPWRAVEVDGEVHRLWQLPDPATHAAVAADLAGRQMLIADGHHRFRAYQRLHTLGGGSRFGLALLVDTGDRPLRLAGIHRSVRGADLDTVLTALAGLPGVRLHDLGADLTDAPVDAVLRDPAPVSAPHARVVLSDGLRTWQADIPRETGLDGGTTDTERTRRRDRLDAAVLQRVVLGRALGVGDTDARVGVHHDLASLGSVTHGLRIAVRAPALTDVMAVAASGLLMPRKSTAFTPKPRSGLVMRVTAR